MSARDDYWLLNSAPFPDHEETMTERQANTALDEIDRLRAEREATEAIRQTVGCPTCDGTQENPDLGRSATYLCPDCTDGKIDMARLLAVGAAVFRASIKVEDHDDAVYLPGHSLSTVRAGELLTELRRVRP